MYITETGPGRWAHLYLEGLGSQPIEEDTAGLCVNADVRRTNHQLIMRDVAKLSSDLRGNQVSVSPTEKGPIGEIHHLNKAILSASVPPVGAQERVQLLVQRFKPS